VNFTLMRRAEIPAKDGSPKPRVPVSRERNGTQILSDLREEQSPLPVLQRLPEHFQCTFGKLGHLVQQYAPMRLMKVHPSN